LTVFAGVLPVMVVVENAASAHRFPATPLPHAASGPVMPPDSRYCRARAAASPVL
jgi:hypothetical protein